MKTLLLLSAFCVFIGCTTVSDAERNLDRAKRLMHSALVYSTSSDVRYPNSQQEILEKGILNKAIQYRCLDGSPRDYLWLDGYTNENPGYLILFFAPEETLDGKLLVGRLRGEAEYVDAVEARRQIGLCREFLKMVKDPEPNQMLWPPEF